MSPDEHERPAEHVDPEEIARLAEGALPPDVAEPMLAHLSQCRSCMAAYAEAVRYRAAWLAERSAFDPPGNVLAQARGAVGPAPPRTRQWPRRLLRVAAPAAAVWLAVTLIARFGQRPGGADATLPPLVVQALAEQTHIDSGLFVPGAEAVRVRTTAAFRGLTDDDMMELRQLAESLYTVYAKAPAGHPREQAGFRYASALAARGRDEADDVIEEVLRSNPKDCACLSLAAKRAYPRALDRAEKILRDAMAAGCRDDVTRMNLAIVRQARGDTAGARGTFEAFEHREDAIGDRARHELGRANPGH